MDMVPVNNEFRIAFVGLPFTTIYGGTRIFTSERVRGPQPQRHISPNQKTHKAQLHALQPVCCTKQDTLASPLSHNMETAESVIRTFWSVVKKGKFSDTLPLFAEDAVYTDTLFPKPFTGIAAVERHFRDMEDAIPPGLVFVLEDVAAGDDRVGVRWHVENEAGTALPFSRGVSMYVLKSEVQADGSTRMMITEAWESVETPFKIAGIVLPVLRFVSSIMKWIES